MPTEPTEPVAGVPTGASTLLEALEVVRRLGFERDMFVTREGLVRCSACHHDARPEELKMHRLVRLEGVSDPGEEACVLALECTVCGMHGSAVVRYGPEAGAGDVAVLRAIEDHRLR